MGKVSFGDPEDELDYQEWPVGQLITDMTSAQYHGITGTYSSSQLKDLLDDPEIFFDKYIAKTIEKKSMTAFDIGTWFHTGVLEPHLLESECVMFTGMRSGDTWERFKLKHAGKAILIASEKKVAEGLIKAVKNSPVAMNRIKRGEPEISCFLELTIQDGDIFAIDKGLKLTPTGWVKVKPPKVSKDAVTLIVKVRADLLGSDFILDLKSTSGNVKSKKEMRRVVKKYQYLLSAALYLDIFTAVTGVLKDTFILTFASKDNFKAKSYKLSPKALLIGRSKWRKAVLELADGIATKWQFTDSLGILEPDYEDMEELETNAEDLI